MLASLLRPKGRREQIDPTPFSSPFTPSDSSPWYRAAAQRASGRAREIDHGSEDDAPDILEEIDEDVDEDWIGEEDEDGEGPIESTPLLPIFSASHLGMHPSRVSRILITSDTDRRFVKMLCRCTT